MTGQDILLDQHGRPLARRADLGHRSARLALGRRHREIPYFRTSFEVSSLDCSIFCVDITSIHQPSCSGFSAGSERFGGVALTSSIGCLVNFEIEAEAFSRSLLTISADSTSASRNFLIAATFFSAHSRDAA